jgi:hypothetical protein
MSATAYIWRSRIAGYPILEGNMNEQREFAKKQQGVRKKERQLVITGDVAYPVTSAYRYIAVRWVFVNSGGQEATRAMVSPWVLKMS